MIVGVAEGQQAIQRYRYTEFGALVAANPGAAAAELARRIDAGEKGLAMAREIGVDVTTLRRWMRQLRDAGHLTTRLRPGRREKARRSTPSAKKIRRAKKSS